MSNKIILKKSSVLVDGQPKVPTAADLEYGELAINYAAGRLYYKRADNTIDFFSSPSDTTPFVTSVDGNTGNITATQLLNSIKNVDGAGSGLDADLLDGQSSSYYLDTSSTAQTKAGTLNLTDPTLALSVKSKINFISADGTKTISSTMYDSGTLSYDGSVGQLFSISDSMSGTIYSVNDISGIPSLEILDTGAIKLGQYNGNVLIGSGTDNGIDKLQVTGSVAISGKTILGGTLGSQTVQINTTTNTGQYFDFDRINGSNTQIIKAVNSNFALATTGAGALTVYTSSTLPQFQVSHTASAVNYANITGAVTGSGPTLSAQGSDTNIDLNLTSKGISSICFNTGSGPAFRAYDSNVGTTVNTWAARGSVTTSAPYLFAQGSDTNVSGYISSKGTGTLIFQTNGGNNTQFAIIHAANSVNYFRTYGAPTGAAVTLESAGADTNIWNNYSTKGTGRHQFLTNNAVQFAVSNTTNAVNYVLTTGATTGNMPAIYGQGSDANVGLRLYTKGAGHMLFTKNRDATTTSQFLFENSGGLYSDASGGAFWRGFHIGAINYTSGGSNRFPRIAQYFEIDAVTDPTYKNAYLAVSNASGENVEHNFANDTGGGFTFRSGTSNNPDKTFRIGAPLSTHRNYIQVDGANASSTPSFSAKGSDADVGIIYSTQGIGSHIFKAGSTDAFIINSQPSAVNYFNLTATATSISPLLQATGADANIDMRFRTRGTGFYQFDSGSNLNTQVKITSTANAVNFVELTGATTGNLVILSGAGSDANVGMELRMKGQPTGPGFRVTNNNGTNIAFAARVSQSNTANYIQAEPSVAGAATGISAQGSDTAINLSLTPKGSGSVIVKSDQSIDTQTATTTATTADQVIATISATTYRTAKIIVSATDSTSNKYHSTELLVVSNGTVAEFTEYASINIGGLCATYSVDVSGGNIRVLATPSSSNSTTFKLAINAIKI